MGAVLAEVSAGRMTADLLARAVIAAAQVYGDDPAEVLFSTSRTGRRCLPAAASAVARGLDITLRPVCRVLSIAYESARYARTNGDQRFKRAEAAAIGAVRYAGWRPGTRRSVVEAAPVEVAAPAQPPKATASHVVRTPRPAPDDVPKLRDRRSAMLTDAELAADRIAAKARREVAAANPAPWDAGGLALSDRILAALAERPASPSALASILDAKEAGVTACIADLAHAGRIVAGEMPEAGRRYQRWRVADAA